MNAFFHIEVYVSERKNTMKEKNPFFAKPLDDDICSGILSESDFSAIRAGVLKEARRERFSRGQESGIKAPLTAVLLSIFFIFMVAFSGNLIYHSPEEAGNEMLALQKGADGRLTISWETGGKYRVAKSADPDFEKSAFVQWIEVEGNTFVDPEPAERTKTVFYKIENGNIDDLYRELKKQSASS